MILLQVSGLAKSVYYYTLSKIDKDDKNKEIIDKIKENIHHIKALLAKLLIERDFNADIPNKKWYTDITEFNLHGEKCYLSPKLDGYNGEVISYNTSKSPNLEQISDMLNNAYNKNNNLEDLVLYSDQGWQY